MKRFYNIGYKSFIILVLIAIALVGCNTDESSKSKSDQAANVNPQLIEIGEKTAKTSCITCHGRDLTGDMGPNLHNLGLTKEQIIEVLNKGKGSMPPSTANGNEEAVAEYLKTLK